ncbi:sensor histidine kinase [Streptomyces sp. NPDC091272]|uniref:sensor histidine kinase n=1 Tax=Streptomyces sp. NPDC091272 TaxID=3365981 RepID=UPI0037F3A280
MPLHEERAPRQKTLEVSDLLAPRLARTILTLALISYLGVTVLNLVGEHFDTWVFLFALLCLGLIFVLQLRHSAAHAAAAPPWQTAATLGAQALLTYLPIVLFHAQWGAMAGFLAGSLLLLLPARAAWPAYGVVGLSMLIPPTLDGLSVVETIYLCQSTLLTGLVVYGLSRLATLVRVLHDTRGELAGSAVANERLRFARDLHDLLGYSLSAITLKSELIHRLIPTHPRRAMEEISEVLTVSRQSLADVRAVSSGLRSMSLEQELGSAQSLLEAADLEVRVEARIGLLREQVDTVLAAVLREAITNLLRHSQAGFCSIEAVQEAGQVRLCVVNDGAHPSYRDVSPHSGSGLGNLQERLRSAHGKLTAEHGPGDTFRLVAEVPACPVRGVADPGAEVFPRGSAA